MTRLSAARYFQPNFEVMMKDAYFTASVEWLARPAADAERGRRCLARSFQPYFAMPPTFAQHRFSAMSRSALRARRGGGFDAGRRRHFRDELASAEASAACRRRRVSADAHAPLRRQRDALDGAAPASRLHRRAGRELPRR